jgi:hypothetical protein
MGGAMLPRPDVGRVVLYVRSEPKEHRRDLPYVETSVFGRMAGFVAPPLLTGRPPSQDALDDPGPNELPPEHQECLVLVEDLARRRRVPLQVIDVTQPAAIGTEPPEALLNLPFPVLVRADGQYLSGEADFTPSAVRRFLRD